MIFLFLFCYVHICFTDFEDFLEFREFYDFHSFQDFEHFQGFDGFQGFPDCHVILGKLKIQKIPQTLEFLG